VCVPVCDSSSAATPAHSRSRCYPSRDDLRPLAPTAANLAGSGCCYPSRDDLRRLRGPGAEHQGQLVAIPPGMICDSRTVASAVSSPAGCYPSRDDLRPGLDRQDAGRGVRLLSLQG